MKFNYFEVLCDEGYIIKETQSYIWRSASQLHSQLRWSLGVALQSNLWWAKNIESITAKTNSTVGMMRSNFKKVPTSVKVQILSNHH